VKAGERREERLGDSLLDEMRRVQRKAWELLDKTESEGDHRGAIVALREVRECLESLGEMLVKADAPRHTGVIEHVLTEREKREAEESLRTVMAEASDAEGPLAEFVEENMISEHKIRRIEPRQINNLRTARQRSFRNTVKRAFDDRENWRLLISGSSIQLWLASGWGCRGRRLSTAQEDPEAHHF